MDLVRIRPRPGTLYVSQGRTVLATDREGFIQGGEHGLLVHRTRLLSRYRWLLDGRPPQGVSQSSVSQHSWLGYYIAPPPGGGAMEGAAGPGGPVAQQTIELRLSRFVGEGFHEDLDLRNYTRSPVELTLALEADADFADQQEAGGRRRQRGEVHKEWRAGREGAWELAFSYQAEHAFDQQGEAGTGRFQAGLRLRVRCGGAEPSCEDGLITFRVSLPPQGGWHACVDALARFGAREMPLHYRCRSFSPTAEDYDRKRELSLGESTRFSTPESGTLSHAVVSALGQAKRDLAALRLYDLDQGEGGWVMAAGLPVYVALFGRDTLTAAWQAALASPKMMHGVLAELTRWQGAEANDWRDEQPGRMLHQADTGPLASLNFNPLGRYYGSVTTSAFYPVALSQLWHWTGDRGLVSALVEPALRGLRWLDRYADPDGDGFYEYRTRSRQGVKNQGWKDSGDCIVYEDGSQVEPPIATCEEQGFVYMAKFVMSELLWRLGRREEARRLFREAGELKRRFNERFWMEKEGFFALALDPRGRLVRSIASNPGHCIATGIVDSARVRRTADRLMSEDLFSGWGIRTLSSRHPAYNPYSYHRGTVWPVEQGTFALAFHRYGLYGHLERLCRAQFEAAALFDFFRLPECFAGHPRDGAHPFPAVYPEANWPQAWSASAVFCFLQALLGLYPYAPSSALIVDPHLPEWLPRITVERLRVGDALVSLQFFRRPDGRSGYRVLDQRGRLHVVRQPSPWSLTDGAGRRIEDLVESLSPAR